nr:hypothetical protein [Tanacetum cinerariifolium]
PATAKNRRTRTCCECGSLGHYKSECPIVKFHEHVDMIHARMRASKPKIMQDAIEIATKLRNKKISTLVECETENKKRHYMRDCPERKNQNQENQIKSTKARGVVHAFGGGETKQDFSNIEDEIEA